MIKREMLNMNTRIVKTNLSDIDLDELYDKTDVSFGRIEMVETDGKEKHSEKMHERNNHLVERKKKRKNKNFFIACVGFTFPEHGLKLFKNGNINIIAFPNETTFEKNIKILFDLLESLGYKPEITESKDILRKIPEK